MAPRHARSRRRHRLISRALTGLLTLVVCAGIVVFLTTSHAYISTPSMYPTIPPGSMVFIEPQRTYHVGEVIEFKGNGLLWVHRLVKIEHNGDLVTKGDNPQSTPDIFVPPRTMRDVVGSVVASVPYLGFPELIAHDPSYGLSWLRAELGLTGKLVVLALVAVICALLVTRKRRQADAADMPGGSVRPHEPHGSNPRKETPVTRPQPLEAVHPLRGRKYPCQP